MNKRRRGMDVHVITTPNDTQTFVEIKTLNEFKHSVAVNANYTPEKNAVYRRFKEKMSSAKVR